MKVIEFHASRSEDCLRLGLEGTFDSRAALEQELEPFLQSLEKYAHGWMPDVIDGKRKRKYSRTSFWKALDECRDGNRTTLGFYRTQAPALDGYLGIHQSADVPGLEMSFKIKPLSFFDEVQRCEKFVDMVRAWASHYPLTHATAHSTDDTELTGAPLFGRDKKTGYRDGFDKVYEVFWLNVFGPELVRRIGRERVLSTPAWRVEELPTGNVLLVTRPTVSDFASDEARLAQARAHAHLRPDLDFHALLGTLRERSALLAPVAPHFPRDLAPLLARVVDHVPSHQRSRQIAAFNAWHPPEPEEWLPAALPCDVDDPARARAHYSTLAEHLVALLHVDVPSIFETTPASLTDVDFHFWREHFPTSHLPEALERYAIPGVGAYLGEVLVRHLGGRWIPRQRLEEAQVLVGRRVWLPFVRARRYLGSREALLDYSLTQVFREAERHAG